MNIPKYIKESELNDKFNEYEKQSLNFIIKDGIKSVDELNRQWNNFFNMHKEKRKQSDEMSLMLTGLTNEQRYNLQMSALSTRESAELGVIKFSKEAINMAIRWQLDSNIKMVYPCDDVDQTYIDFMSQNNRLKNDADNKCVELFGMKCEELYQFLKDGEKTIVNIDDKSDYELSSSLSDITSNETDLDNYMAHHYNEFTINKIHNTLNDRHSKMNEIKWEYTYSPYFTPEEIRNNSGYFSNLTNDQCKRIAEEYTKAFYGLENSFDCIEWDDCVRKLFYLRETSDSPIKIAQYNQSLIDIGWNPEIPYTDKSRLQAHNRIQKAYSEQYKNIELIDNTGLFESFDEPEEQVVSESMKSGYYPVHIILVKGNSLFSDLTVKITDGPYSHAAICLDNDFKRLYSFNMNSKNKLTSKQDGFSLESIDGYPKDNQLGVYTFFVDKDQYECLNYNIQQILLHQNETNYSILNLMTLLFKNINLNLNAKMICSQFVDRMLKLANIDISNMPSDKVTPNGFYYTIINNSKIYKTYEGPVKDFNCKKAEKFVEKMSRKAKYINEFVIESPTDYYTIPVITEAKSIIKFNSNGDALLTKPTVFLNLDDEYSQSHKLLMSYEKTNNYEGMKYELCRLFYMNYILEKRLNMKGERHQSKTKDLNTRARVLNDFNKYMNILLKNQPKFNFSEYYEQSPFYPNTLEVDADTIKYTTDQIKAMLLL